VATVSCRPDPVKLRTNAAGRAKARSVAQTYADPDTTEKYIIDGGIGDRAALDAVMARTNKGPDLIRAVIDDVVNGWASWPNAAGGWVFATNTATDLIEADADGVLTSLLGEPALRAADLRAMIAWPSAHLRAGLHADLLVAVCTHPRVEAATVAAGLWNCGPDVAQAVAARRGDLLGPATWWVRAQAARGEGGTWGRGSYADGRLDLITTTVARWEAACGGEPELRAFVARAFNHFTNETDMFTAGRAICAHPTANPTR